LFVAAGRFIKKAMSSARTSKTTLVNGEPGAWPLLAADMAPVWILICR
jgi:hypothetical protein